MDFTPSLQAKKFFRFTGPPEHWLTAIKFMTWGLEKHYLDRWKKIQSGDIFFIHSTGSSTSQFSNAKSGIIGLGVVGPDFTIKDQPLWLYELQKKENKWPLLIPLSEIYLFTKLPITETWSAPRLGNEKATEKLIDFLVSNIVPLSQIEGFPQMGSFSSVREEVAMRILNDKRSLYLYTGEPYEGQEDGGSDEKNFREVKTASEAFRYADTLQIFANVKTRVIKEPTSFYMRDNEFLSLADTTHSTILQQLIDIFRSKGYDTRKGKHVDLFAHNNTRAFLLEVKSTENKNFRSQVRKGIAQLLEYDYFDVQEFIKQNNLQLEDRFKLIIPSREPEDARYVSFMNSLKIGIALVNDKRLQPVGDDFGFSKL